MEIFSSQRGTLNRCWFNAGPASQTMSQHKTNIGPRYRVCWVARKKNRSLLRNFIKINCDGVKYLAFLYYGMELYYSLIIGYIVKVPYYLQHVFLTL